MTGLNANWNYPNNIRVGAGRIKELAEACVSLGIKAPLLVTDPGLSALPMVAQAVAVCTDAGLGCSVFSDIQLNPTGKNIAAGIAAFNTGNHDGVIAFGGGSAIDTAKAIALMVGQQRPLWDFEDVGDNWRRANENTISPVVAVPTTAGTGSEVGRASVIMDERAKVKKVIFHPNMLPQLVILDPELTAGLPPHITAATGMDALSHSLEAFCSPAYHPMADGMAIEGIRLVKMYLPRAVADGQDLEARTQMLVASTMGAAAFQKGLGAMHAIAHTLGALYNAHHGLLNAILMPYVLVANRGEIETKIERLSDYLALDDTSFDGFLGWVLAIRAQLQIPHTLSAIDIDNSEAERIGQMAVNDPSAAGNPVAFSAGQYRQLFLNALSGQFNKP